MKKSLILSLLCVAAFAVSAGVVRQETFRSSSAHSTEDKKVVQIPVYTMENDKVIIRIDPERGGRGVSFYLKDRKLEMVNPSHDVGFFIDHWAKFLYPSGLMNLRYTPEVLNLKGAMGLRLTLTVPAKGGGKGNRDMKASRAMATDESLIGLQIVKTITVQDGSDVVKVSMELKNPTKKASAGALHFQHGFRITPQRDRYRWDMPNTEGIVGPAMAPGKAQTGKLFVNDPVAGWLSVNDLKDFNLVFEYDYNYLDRTYSCGITAEWIMENAMLSAGKSFKTEYYIYPTAGLERVTFAKKGIIAGIRADETAKGFKVSTDILSKTGTRKDLNLEVKVYSHKNKNVITGKTFKIGTLTDKVSTFTLNVPHKEEIVIRAFLSDGKGLKEQFEYNYFDEKTEYNRRFRYGSLSDTGAAILAGGSGSAYKVKPPVKIKTMDLPDFNKINKFPKDKNRMLVLFGFYTDHLKIYETFRNDPKTEILWCNANPTGVNKFPATFDDLFKYRTIFMCNVNFKSMRFEGIEMIRHWISQGGTLVITGGFFTYGNGEYEGTPFEKYIPFTNLKPFDLVRKAKGECYSLTVTGNHPELAGVSFADAPEVAWLHKLQLKPEAVVLAKAGPLPAIVKMKYGKGTVIGCTLTPMGEPEKPFWLGEDWRKFLVNCSKINKN